MLTDAHVHLYDCFLRTGKFPDLGGIGAVCASAHGEGEFSWQESLARQSPCRVLLSFGVHPQEPLPEGLAVLDSLAAAGRIHAVGEAGFDAWNDSFRSTLKAQGYAWNAQLETALRYGLPLVVHCRKALDFIFADSRRLARLPSVVFHGWPGSPLEAESFLKRGVNAWFSAGKGLLRGDKSLSRTVTALGPSRVVAETDAPWMTLRGEAYSLPSDIRLVHAELASLWGLPAEEAEAAAGANFFRAYGVSP